MSFEYKGLVKLQSKRSRGVRKLARRIFVLSNGAKTRTRQAVNLLPAALVAAVSFSFPGTLYALPSGATGDAISNGLVVLDPSGNTLDINQTSPGRHELVWDGVNAFDVAGNETVNFNLLNNNSAILNRVLNSGPSGTNILGTMNINRGTVFIIDVNGVLFNATGGDSINVGTANNGSGNLIASTLDVLNFDQSNWDTTGELTFSGSSAAVVGNSGTMDATNNDGDPSNDGNIMFVGANIANSGSGAINAGTGTVILASSGQALVTSTNSMFAFESQQGLGIAAGISGAGGTITAGTVNMEIDLNGVLDGVINTGGTLEATSILDIVGTSTSTGVVDVTLDQISNNTNDLSVTTSGGVTQVAAIDVAGAITIDQVDAFVQSQNLTSGGAISITSDAGVSVLGGGSTLTDVDGITLTAGGAGEVTSTGALAAVGDLTIVQQAAYTQAQNLSSGGAISITSDAGVSVLAGGSTLTDVDGITLTAGGAGEVTSTGALAAVGDLAIVQEAAYVQAQNLSSGGAISITSDAGVSVQAGGLTLTDVNGISLTAGGTGEVTSTGALTAVGDLNIVQEAAYTQAQNLSSGGAISITSDAGVSVQAGGLTLTDVNGISLTAGGAGVVASTGALAAVGDLSITQDTAAYVQSQNLSSGGTLSITSGGDVTVLGGATTLGDTTGITLVSGGATGVSTGSALTATGNLTILQAAGFNQSQSISSLGSVSISSLTGDVVQDLALSSGSGSALNASGSVTSSGAVTGALAIDAGGNVDIDRTGTFSQTGDIESGGSIDINSSGGGVSVQNGFLLTDVSGIRLEAGGVGTVTSTGALAAAGDLTIVQQAAYAQSQDLSSGGAISITSDAGVSVLSTGLTDVNGISLTAGGVGQVVSTGALAATGDLTIVQDAAYNQSQDLSSGGAISITSNNSSITQDQSLNATSGSTLTAAGNVISSGAVTGALAIDAGGNVDIDRTGAFAQSGDIEAGGTIDINSANGGVSVLNGFLLTDVSGIRLEAGGAGEVTSSSALAATGDLTIVQEAAFTQAQNLSSGGAISITSDAGVSVLGAGLTDVSGISLTAGGAGQVTTNAALAAVGDLTIVQDATFNQSQNLSSGGAISITSNSNNIIQDQALSSVSGSTLTAAGNVTSSGSVTGALAIDAGGNVDIDRTGAFAQSGDIEAGGSIDINSTNGGVSVQNGFLFTDGSGIRLEAGGAGTVTSTGALAATGDLTIVQEAAYNQTQNLSSGGAISITSDAGVSVISGGLSETNGLSLEAGGAGQVVSTGALAASGDLSIVQDATYDQSQDLSSGGAISIASNNNDVIQDMALNSVTGSTLTAAGNVTSSGAVIGDLAIDAGGNVDIDRTAAFVQTGAIEAGGSIDITSADGVSVQNGFALTDGTGIRLEAGGAGEVVSSGALAASGDLTIVQQAAYTQSQNLSSGGAISITSSAGVSVLGAGLTDANGISLTAGGAGQVTSDAAIAATGDLTIVQDATFDQSQDFSSGGAISITSNNNDVIQDQALSSASGSTLTAAGSVTSTGQVSGGLAIDADGNVVIDRAAAFVQTGDINAGGTLAITSANGVSVQDGASLTVGGDVTLQAGGTGVVDTNGALDLSGNLSITQQADYAQTGNLSADGSIEITSTGGSVTHADDLSAGSSSTLDADTDVVSSGTVSGGALILVAGENVIDSGSYAGPFNITAGDSVLISRSGDLAISGADLISAGNNQSAQSVGNVFLESLSGSISLNGVDGTSLSGDSPNSDALSVFANQDVSLDGTTIANFDTVVLGAEQGGVNLHSSSVSANALGLYANQGIGIDIASAIAAEVSAELVSETGSIDAAGQINCPNCEKLSLVAEGNISATLNEGVDTALTVISALETTSIGFGAQFDFVPQVTDNAITIDFADFESQGGVADTQILIDLVNEGGSTGVTSTADRDGTNLVNQGFDNALLRDLALSDVEVVAIDTGLFSIVEPGVKLPADQEEEEFTSNEKDEEGVELVVNLMSSLERVGDFLGLR